MAVEEICYPGQPHGFVNFGFPAAARVFDDIGAWLTKLLGPVGSAPTIPEPLAIDGH